MLAGRVVLWTIGVAAAAVACGSRTQLRGTSGIASSKDASVDTSAPPLQQGIVLDDCAPNDAPAYSFEVGTTPVPTCSEPTLGAGSIMISIWEPLPVGPGTFAIGSGAVSAGSVALVCINGPSDCTPAHHGTLVLTDFDPSSPHTASGSYTVVMSDGTTFVGSFSDLVLCHNFAGCG